MLDDTRLAWALAAAAEMERAARHHLTVTEARAAEQARAHVVVRHATALRKALEDWIETRAYRAAQT